MGRHNFFRAARIPAGQRYDHCKEGDAHNLALVALFAQETGEGRAMLRHTKEPVVHINLLDMLRAHGCLKLLVECIVWDSTLCTQLAICQPSLTGATSLRAAPLMDAVPAQLQIQDIGPDCNVLMQQLVESNPGQSVWWDELAGVLKTADGAVIEASADNIEKAIDQGLLSRFNSEFGDVEFQVEGTGVWQPAVNVEVGSFT